MATAYMVWHEKVVLDSPRNSLVEDIGAIQASPWATGDQNWTASSTRSHGCPLRVATELLTQVLGCFL